MLTLSEEQQLKEKRRKILLRLSEIINEGTQLWIEFNDVEEEMRNKNIEITDEVEQEFNGVNMGVFPDSGVNMGVLCPGNGLDMGVLCPGNGLDMGVLFPGNGLDMGVCPGNGLDMGVCPGNGDMGVLLCPGNGLDMGVCPAGKDVGQVSKKRKGVSNEGQSDRKPKRHKSKLEKKFEKALIEQMKGEISEDNDSDEEIAKKSISIEELAKKYEKMMKRVDQEMKARKIAAIARYKYGKWFKRKLEEESQKYPKSSTQTIRKRIYDGIAQITTEKSRKAIKVETNRAIKFYELIEEIGGKEIIKRLGGIFSVKEFEKHKEKIKNMNKKKELDEYNTDIETGNPI